MALLLEAHRYAQDVQRPLWDFAVEIGELRKAGLTHNDLRWLICKKYVEHARETTLAQEESRSFRRRRSLCFGRRTCFVLTLPGVGFAQQSLKMLRVQRRFRVADLGVVPSPKLRPQWDRDRQELRVGSFVVKQFKVPAVNQERLLAAFEEEGWPVRIDDPLPPQKDQDPKRRLHDTINSLNRKQRYPLIRFLGDGTGQGVRWQLILPGANGDAVPAVES
jgi:hypothetical protein